jgi:hypothetical protein
MFHKHIRSLYKLIGAAALLLVSLNSEANVVNLALSGTAQQSSLYPAGNGYSLGYAYKAIDGNTNGSWNNQSVTHTNNDVNAWWRVDLGNTYALNSITLWNRTDCCSDRLSNFTVSVLNSAQSKVFSESFFTNGGTFASNLDIALPNGIAGQFVKVQLNGQNPLSLAEVQVYGNAAPVPEPEEWAMMLLGFGMVGWQIKRKQRKPAPTAA